MLGALAMSSPICFATHNDADPEVWNNLGNALVQLALPEALAAAAAIALAGSLAPVAVTPFWPDSSPLVVQIGLMLLAVDCMRYWLHRACHRFPLLWRLHAVHHSPAILYSLNSGRFHPLEKALHFCLDAMPFIVLGVGQEVIAGYFVIYAANGLFQHSNVRLKYGWLNYVVGSAETHRWHHARDPRIAHCNFGSTTAVWDVMFGTWYLPKGRHVEEVGIMDKDYPKGFIALLVAPFRDHHGAQGSHAVQRWFANILVTMRLRLTLLIQGLRIAAAVRDPMRVQRALLERILRENRDTAFGRRYGFGETEGYEMFAQSVPVGDYEALRPYIDAEIERGESALTDEAPRQYVRTSGSTGNPKDIPLVPRHLDALRRIHETSVAFQYRNCPAAFTGSILAIVSPQAKVWSGYILRHAARGAGEIRDPGGSVHDRRQPRQVSADPALRAGPSRHHLHRHRQLDDIARVDAAIPRVSPSADR